MNNARWLALVGAIAFAGLAGCKQVDDRPAEWPYISPAIFQPNCATTSCHNPAAAVSGLDFSTPDNGYASLTKLWVWVVFAPDAAVPGATPCGVSNGTRVCEEKERPLVTPYDPAGSRLVNMLRARDAPRMPPDRPLPELDIQLVERWILNGALEYPGMHPPPDASPDAKRLDSGAPHDGAGSDGRPADASHG